MNGNGASPIVTPETPTEKAIRLMSTKDIMRGIIKALDTQAATVSHLRDVSAENTTRLNENDENIRIIGRRLTELASHLGFTFSE